MTVKEIKEKLDLAFGKYEFFPEDHHYECNGKRVGISVTTFYDQYVNEFQQQEVAEKCAIRDNKTIDEVLKEWKYKNDFSKPKGTNGHSYVQCLWNNEKFEELHFDNSIEFKNACSKVYKQADNFYKDYQDILEHIADEFVIGSEEFDIASAIDHLFYNKLTGNLVLVDYKTNRILKGYNDELKNRKYTKKMKVPLQNIKDDVLHHYYIQISIYIYLIEKYTNLKVEEYFIVYFSEDIENYEIIKIDYLKDEVEKILEMRKNMAKMILIMGDGGSGKTSSLRKLPPEELFYIDCDKKGLNFKGWKEKFIEKKNYYKTDDSNVIMSLLKKINDDKPEFKYIAIDTINSIMIADEMRRRKDKGYDKWDDLAFSIQNLIVNAPDLRDDLTIIFAGHTQTEDDGFTRLLTNGKKLNKIGLEKYFNTVLLSKCVDGKYIFETRANNSTARTPFEAFDELEIDNDITKVIEVLKEY